MAELSRHDLAVRMADLARTVATPRTVDEILADVTATATELIAGVDTAGVLLVAAGGKFESLAGTSDLPHILDELQMTFQEGPCMQAALDDVVVRTDDFREETRWPSYSKVAIEIGVLSGLSLKLYTADRTAGALNLFGFQPRAWDSEAETIGTVLAAHAAAALLAGRHTEQLTSALSTRDRIGQAKGIIMERYQIDDIQAFELLRRLSQESNTKLIDVAQQVIDTRA
ncbi:GAF and ANTAR domain-containing protein [Mycolicibacterium neworleansense]|uniref:Response regulator receiver/ANTAR domain-containing protein n=1 Tax=Mycolicibacterium neworleansense TaxID=146018 RepID=A0A0H5RW91_9MYCO|nr:GAF and ANTAR domain-containing protein [Mycolicibacterium neworleansense]MCV7360796.1 GAF and ANTAR domain-containing protein [Mycolicibacterium neworleansense]CRZ18198.1 response regulator receiver/ANTAR domain-containing protein [Mycolicibacterium neworleansense]